MRFLDWQWEPSSYRPWLVKFFEFTPIAMYTSRDAVWEAKTFPLELRFVEGVEEPLLGCTLQVWPISLKSRHKYTYKTWQNPLEKNHKKPKFLKLAIPTLKAAKGQPQFAGPARVGIPHLATSRSYTRCVPQHNQGSLYCYFSLTLHDRIVFLSLSYFSDPKTSTIGCTLQSTTPLSPHNANTLKKPPWESHHKSITRPQHIYTRLPKLPPNPTTLL